MLNFLLWFPGVPIRQQVWLPLHGNRRCGLVQVRSPKRKKSFCKDVVLRTPCLNREPDITQRSEWWVVRYACLVIYPRTLSNAQGFYLNPRPKTLIKKQSQMCSTGLWVSQPLQWLHLLAEANPRSVFSCSVLGFDLFSVWGLAVIFSTALV